MSSNIADVNGDGYGDLILHYGDPTLGDSRGGKIVLSDGTDNIDSWTRTYLPNEIFIGNTKMNHSNFGDLDGDGDIDLIIGNTRENPYYDGRKVSILTNDGSGNFTDSTSTLIPYTQSREPTSDEANAVGGGEGEVYIRDWDGDGDLDIVTGNNGSKNHYYINNKSSFKLNHFSENDKVTYGITLGDLNNDGTLDIIESNSGDVNKVFFNKAQE